MLNSLDLSNHTVEEHLMTFADAYRRVKDGDRSHPATLGYILGTRWIFVVFYIQSKLINKKYFEQVTGLDLKEVEEFMVNHVVEFLNLL